MESIWIDSRAWPEEKSFKIKVGIKSTNSWGGSQSTSKVNIIEAVGFQFWQSMVNASLAEGRDIPPK